MNRLFTAITLLLLTLTGAYAADTQADTTAKDTLPKDTLTATVIGKFNNLYLPAEKLESAIPAQNFKHIASIGNNDQVVMITFDNGFPPVSITFDSGYILDIDKNETNAKTQLKGIRLADVNLSRFDIKVYNIDDKSLLGQYQFPIKSCIPFEIEPGIIYRDSSTATHVLKGGGYIKDMDINQPVTIFSSDGMDNKLEVLGGHIKTFDAMDAPNDDFDGNTIPSYFFGYMRGVSLKSGADHRKSCYLWLYEKNREGRRTRSNDMEILTDYNSFYRCKCLPCLVYRDSGRAACEINYNDKGAYNDASAPIDISQPMSIELRDPYGDKYEIVDITFKTYDDFGLLPNVTETDRFHTKQLKITSILDNKLKKYLKDCHDKLINDDDNISCRFEVTVKSKYGIIYKLPHLYIDPRKLSFCK